MTDRADRELLELAAKAAGEPYFEHAPEGGLYLSNGEHWNPLTDDGDALRLAVKLGMTVNCENDIEVACATSGWMDGNLLPEGVGTENYGEDPLAATRLAIVRAAAEIGRQS